MRKHAHPAQSVTLPAKPQRLLFLQHSSVFDHYGGVEYYLDDFLEVATEIYGAKKIHTVVARRTNRPALRPYSMSFVPFSTNPFLGKMQNRFSLAYFTAALEQIKSFRPTLLVNSHVSLGSTAYLLHRVTRIPFVTCVYGIDCWGNLWPQDEWCLKNASGILSISHWTKKILTDRGFQPTQIHIVHPKLPTIFESPKIGRKKIASRPFTLLTISRLDEREQYKGQDHVLQALSLLKKRSPALDIRYLIQGEGGDQPRLEALSRSLNLTDCVEFRPKVADRSGLEQLYGEADVFIMPSQFGRWQGAWRGEGFGIVYVEAAAFGLPSIAYRCGGATDIVRDQETGWLVEPGNISKLAEAIHFAATHPDVVTQTGKKAKEETAERFGNASMRLQMIQTFNQF